MKLSDLFADLDPRTAGALERAVRGLRDEIVDRVDALRGELLGSPASESPGPARRDGLEALRRATAEIDAAGSQAGILGALLEGAGAFASRAAFFVISEAGLRCWGSLGFDEAGRPLEGEILEAPAGSAWTRIADAGAALTLDAGACRSLSRHFDAAEANDGVLVPMMLGESVAGCLYGDRLADGPLDVTALQLLTFAAGQVLETLPVRGRSSTATLRLAGGAAPAPAPAPEVEEAAEPAPAADESELPEGFELEPAPPPPAAPETPPVEAPSEPVEEWPEPVEEPPPPFEAPAEPIEAPAEPAEEPAAPIADAPTAPLEAESPSAEQLPVAEPPAPDELPEPPVPPAPETPAATEQPEDRRGTEVAAPEDVQGPGWAFTTQKIPRDSGEEARSEEARRLARLLVTEIKLYNEEQVEQGRRNGDIYRRLQEDIDRSRQIFEDRMERGLQGDTDYFRQALVRILAGGDESLLGD